MQRDLKFIPGDGSKLIFDVSSGFAINPESQNSIAFAGGHRNQAITVSGTGTITIYGSAQKQPVDFSKSSTIDNSYAVMVVADYSLAANQYITSVVVSSSTRIVEINTNLLTWIGIHRSVDTVNVKFTETDNQ